MIRRSLLVAAVAVVLSLLVHGMGLNFMPRQDRAQPDAGQAAPAGASFVDFAEVIPATPEPEEAQPPEPPEPIEADIPSTEVLVASDNPQDVTTPDTGTARVTEPDAAETEQADTPPPETAQSPAPQETPATEVAETPPQQAESAQETPPAEPAERPEPPETPEVETADTPPVLEAETPQVTVEAAPDLPGIEAETADETVLGAAVTTSLRPPSRRPPAPDATETETETETAQETGTDTDTGTGTRTTNIQVSGLELLAQEISRRDSGSTGATAFSGARATGNADTTNYAGRVLVQLNRKRRLNSEEKGSARVEFQIDPDGTVAWVRVFARSGSPGIDRIAAAQVRSAAPFPRPPDGTPQRLAFVYRSD